MMPGMPCAMEPLPFRLTTERVGASGTWKILVIPNPFLEFLKNYRGQQIDYGAWACFQSSVCRPRLAECKPHLGWMINWRWLHPAKGVEPLRILPATGDYPVRQHLVDRFDSCTESRKRFAAALANCINRAHREKTLFRLELLQTRDYGLESTIWFRLIGRVTGAKDIPSVTPRSGELCAPFGSCQFSNYRETRQIRKLVRQR